MVKRSQNFESDDGIWRYGSQIFIADVMKLCECYSTRSVHLKPGRL